jgi:hypothetical protein
MNSINEVISNEDQGEQEKNHIGNELIQNEEDNLSALSLSSYDSIDNIKLHKMGQYTCNECSEIPKIINTDITTKKILIQCKNHGQKEFDIKQYLYNALNYNSNNWKCATCDKIQRNVKEVFKFCECGCTFCEQCFSVHKNNDHSFSIDSNQYDLRCKKNREHFDNKYIGFCVDCHEHFCKKCEEEHSLHTVIQINSMQINKGEIEKIRKLNKEYRSLISYYESLIRLNNLIIYSYENYRDNYYNLFNINNIINNYKRNPIIDNYQKTEYKTIIPGEKNCNLFSYMSTLHNLPLTEEETESIELDNKFFNDYDLRVLTQLPLKNLHLLVLENNCITNIDCLENAEFPDLVILNLNNNAISDISVLKKIKFVELQAFLIRNNNIKDISVFGEVKFELLREIDLRDNKIEDIQAFSDSEKIKELQCLYLTGNKFDIKNPNFATVKARLEKLEEFEC